MKGISILFLLISIFVLIGCAGQQSALHGSNSRVLIILRETATSGHEESLETAETATIARMLNEAGFQVTVASRSGRTFNCPFTGASFKAIRLARAHASDFVALMIPSNRRKSQYYEKQATESECVTIVQEAVRREKLVAAQRWGVVVLAEAGVLVGRQYAFPDEPVGDPRFANATRNSKMVVQDGSVITCNLCPFSDPGIILTETLIAALGN